MLIFSNTYTIMQLKFIIHVPIRLQDIIREEGNDMSFMYNPYPYDDSKAVNQIDVASAVRDTVVSGAVASAKVLAKDIAAIINEKGRCIIAIDGYISAPIDLLAHLTIREIMGKNISISTLHTKNLFKKEEVLKKELLHFLPEDPEDDPTLLYGRLFPGGYEDLMEAEKVKAFEKQLSDFSANGEGALLLYGNGSLIQQLRGYGDLRIYVDMTQKRTVLNIKGGRTGNLGFNTVKPFNTTLRHAYYVDFEVSAALRGEVIQNREIDYYIAGDKEEDMQLIPLESFVAICQTLVQYPLRCRPVYIEGVWGGYYIKKLRDLPDEMVNCAWVFDLIPMEVSIVAQMEDLQIEMPYFGFIQTVSNELMGEKCVKKFEGFFPIRFNYDDTFHASGNMSIQVHPDSEYVKKHNDELGRQDESYYIVVAGQEAKTYCGFQDGFDMKEFMAEVRRSQKDGIAMDHDKYVYSKPSQPGMQFMVPAGTIHASGRNQVILEIGSLTIGSYTYKLYDYVRKDLDGKPRPIHANQGEKVLQTKRTKTWVEENLIQKPQIVRNDEMGKEIIVGEHELLYFSLRNLCFDNRMTDDTKDRFHVLVLVEGEEVMIRSLKDPKRFFIQNYLDMVVVPASFGEYEVINQGVGSVVVHKTMLREGYENIIK